MSEWRSLPQVPKPQLIEARLQCHWASTLVAAVGASVLQERADYTHTSLTRPAGSPFLVGEPLEGSGGDRIALSIADLSLLRLDADLEEKSTYPLSGKTFEDGRQWLSDALGAEIKPVGYELPGHALGEGGKFSLESPEALQALAQGFVNASTVLDVHSPETVRCWPHHFDIAFLITLGDEESVGVGWIAGDGSYDEPYWYATPWPYPKPLAWPDLPRGHWHKQGFVAAILAASEMPDTSEADSEQAAVDEFLKDAVAANRALLEKEQNPNE